MNSRIPHSIVLSLLLFAAGPRLAAQQVVAGQAAPQQSSQQPDSDARPPLSPTEMKEERARNFMAEKRYEAAITTYQDLLKSSPKNAIYMNMIGIGYLDLSNYDEAKRYFLRSEKADKKYPSAVNNLGMVYYHQKDYRRAIREYKKAVAIDPQQGGTHANLGFAYYNTKKIVEAATEFQRALELDPQVFDRNAKVGTMVQDRSVTNHGLFFFTMARVYAQKADAPHCAEYLRKSLDEGYKEIGEAKTDPAFKPVLDDPGVQAVLVLITPVEQKDAASRPGA